jgi:tripartite-type tricarboxylate transporter receptor subunit TctC
VVYHSGAIYRNGPNPLMRTVITLIAAIAIQAASGAAFAQVWPARPGRIIVTSTPGGTLDALARVLGDDFTRTFGQPWVVEARPGVSGNLGAEFVVKAPADGYTVLVCPPGPFAVNPHLLGAMTFEPNRDLIPVTRLAVAPLLLVVHPSVPAKNLRELIDWARASGKVNFASQGIGSISQLAMELLRSKFPFEANHIPYKGSATAATDLIAGHVPVAFDNATQAMPNIRAGRLRAIAVAEKKRLEVAPEIPTLDESGFPGFEANTWLALAVRSGTPREVVNRLFAEAVRAMNRPDIVERFARTGVDVRTSASPEEFASYVRTESEKWGAVIRATGARAD